MSDEEIRVGKLVRWHNGWAVRGDWAVDGRKIWRWEFSVLGLTIVRSPWLPDEIHDALLDNAG